MVSSKCHSVELFMLIVAFQALSSTTSLPLEIAEQGFERCKRRELYHNATGACYREGTKGPCNGSMRFFKFSQHFGDCDCPDEAFSVPFVYNEAANDCYETYQQAYCSPGEWLIYEGKDLKGACVPNPCASRKGNILQDGEGETIVLFKGSCVALNKPSNHCGPGEEIIIKEDEVWPECGVSSIAEMSVFNTNQLRCRPGTRKDRNGNCRRTVTISSD